MPTGTTWSLVEGNLNPASRPVNTSIGSSGIADDSYTGVLQSSPFPVSNQFYTVLIAGSNQYEETHISFRDAENQAEYWRVTGNNSDVLTSSVIDLTAAIGRKVQVVAVDKRSAPGGKITFGGLYHMDQLTALDELVDFHINLLQWRHSRGDGENWLHKNLQERHLPKLYQQALHSGNEPQKKFCLNAIGKFPSSGSVPVLLELSNQPNEMFARYALTILRDHNTHYTPQERVHIEDVATRLLTTTPSNDLRIICAGTLYTLNTPTAIRTLETVRLTAPRKVAVDIDFLLKSEQFNHTEFVMPMPGKATECWLKGFQYFVYMPTNWNRGKKWRLLVGCHGTWGRGSLYAREIQAECDRLGVVGIAPTFDPHRFWGFGHFGGKIRPDLILIEAIQTIKRPLFLADKPVVIFGHSEGAQFTNRFTLVHWQSVQRAAMSGTDELCFPDPNLIFPFGTKHNPDMQGGLPALSPAAWLKVPTTLVVGTNDHKANIAISESWAKAMDKYAEENGYKESVRFIRHEGGIHSMQNNLPLFQDWLAEGFKE